MFKKYDDKIVVLTSKNCPECESFKRRVMKRGDIKEHYVFLDIEDSDEAKIIADTFDIRAVPSLFGVRVVDRKVYLCKLNDNYETEACMEADLDEE